MLVSYTYRSDDPVPSEDNESGSHSKTATAKVPAIKTFAFYTVVDLGSIIPRETSKLDPDS